MDVISGLISVMSRVKFMAIHGRKMYHRTLCISLSIFIPFLHFSNVYFLKPIETAKAITLKATYNYPSNWNILGRIQGSNVQCRAFIVLEKSWPHIIGKFKKLICVSDDKMSIKMPIIEDSNKLSKKTTQRFADDTEGQNVPTFTQRPLFTDDNDDKSEEKVIGSHVPGRSSITSLTWVFIGLLCGVFLAQHSTKLQTIRFWLTSNCGETHRVKISQITAALSCVCLLHLSLFSGLCDGF